MKVKRRYVAIIIIICFGVLGITLIYAAFQPQPTFNAGIPSTAEVNGSIRVNGNSAIIAVSLQNTDNSPIVGISLAGQSLPRTYDNFSYPETSSMTVSASNPIPDSGTALVTIARSDGFVVNTDYTFTVTAKYQNGGTYSDIITLTAVTSTESAAP